jgi:hypothetical protein
MSTPRGLEPRTWEIRSLGSWNLETRQEKWRGFFILDQGYWTFRNSFQAQSLRRDFPLLLS